jgi:peptidoglycan/xylan/chitin deacetylase (PgdA/CDA1 family)
MQRPVSSIWQRLPTDLVSRTEHCIQNACEHTSTPGEIFIFFRADDIAAPGRRFTRLLDIFSSHRAPLCLAVVPAWLTRPRWQALIRAGHRAASCWCWHQHGWRHTNHETQGKKQEFGPMRSRADLEHDIRCGRQRLENLLGNYFYPVFTPPWNRCDQKTLAVLKDLGYAAVSRSRGSRPPSAAGLLSFDVNVDLHTRKERSAADGWENLFAELHSAIASGRGGIMIHHQRMNDAAFAFLEILLGALTRCRRIELVHFKDLGYTAPQ